MPIDVDVCSDNELVDVGNHKNEVRFTFSQIHQYLQYGTNPSDFQKSDKHALPKFFKSADGNLHHVGGGKLAICLLLHSLFSVLSYFILQRDLHKIGALIQERIVVDDPDRRKRIGSSIHEGLNSGHVISVSCFCTLIILYFALPTCKLTEIEVFNVIYCMVMAKFSKTKKFGPQNIRKLGTRGPHFHLTLALWCVNDKSKGKGRDW